MNVMTRLALLGSAVAMLAALQPATADGEREIVRVSGTGLLPAACAHEDAQPESEVEPRVAANPADRDNLVAVWQQDRHVVAGGARGTGVATSFDGGRSWTPATVPGFGCLGDVDAKASDPWVSFGPDGRAYVSALVWQDDRVRPGLGDDPYGVAVATSTDGGTTWSVSVLEVPGTGEPPVATGPHRGLSWDKPTITADPYRAGTAYLTWSQFAMYTCPAEFCNPTSATVFARTDDGGRSWSPPRLVGASPLPFEQMSNPEIAVLPDGTLVVMHVTFEYHDDVAGNAGPCLELTEGLCGVQTIRSQASTDGGASWSAPTVVASGRFPAEITDPEPAPGAPTMVRASWGWYPFTQAAGPGGRLYAAWVNRHFATTSAESADGVPTAEIQLAESDDGGRSWRVRSVMSFAHEVFTPTLAVDDRGTLALTWYDLRGDVEGDAEWSADAWFASSRDGGSTWRPRRLAGPFDLRQSPVTGNLGGDRYFLGDYHGLAHTGNHVVAVFALPVRAATRQSDIVSVRVPRG